MRIYPNNTNVPYSYQKAKPVQPDPSNSNVPDSHFFYSLEKVHSPVPFLNPALCLTPEKRPQLHPCLTSRPLPYLPCSLSYQVLLLSNKNVDTYHLSPGTNKCHYCIFRRSAAQRAGKSCCFSIGPSFTSALRLAMIAELLDITSLTASPGLECCAAAARLCECCVSTLWLLYDCVTAVCVLYGCFATV
jgi:hypothetical protein